MNKMYAVRSSLYGLLWKVVIFSDNYDRRTVSYHFTYNGAYELCRKLNEERQ
ncbi:hypothetical protein [Vibrio phage XZ1]|uniref:Uncharacterized protein n=1 Tax=Vibrio phage ValKK3 TaxID=1610855 RepID=A0A0D4DAN1_9CAUD|nr:hypothetical protein AVU32_gp065 [Vibrio phage ValKK3]AJT60906.1 hypothetical protein [Vibrio phage ValKK3]UOL51332.1 hypothetical protein [Vibrio phage XZ1]